MSRGLGRGFGSLIPDDLLDESFDVTAEQDEQVSDLRKIKIDEIEADSEQPRRSFDEDGIFELSESIARHGVLQPIVVTPKNGKYLIVAGERRWRAAKKAGLEKIPALVRTLSGQHKLELSLIENLQRRDLNPIETATAYAKLRDQFNLNPEEIGKAVGGKSASAITNTLRLMKLPKNVQQALMNREVREGQVRPLIGQDEELIEKVLGFIINEGWSARKVEQFMAEYKNQPAKAKVEDKGDIVKNTQPYQKEVDKFIKRFDTKVSVRTNAKGAGQIVIKFKNDEDFQRIKKLLD